MIWEYIQEVFHSSWEFLTGSTEVAEFFFCGLMFFLPRFLPKHEKGKLLKTDSARMILFHKFVTNEKWRFFVVGLAGFIFHMLVVAPYQIYKTIAPENESLKKQIEDKSAKLDGFIHRIMTADEAGTTNSVIFIDASISNVGGAPSIAEEYELTVNFSNRSVKAEEINFTEEYKMAFIHQNKP